MFERIISIDWSGAGEEDAGVDLRIASWDEGRPSIVDRSEGGRSYKSWSRAACRRWLAERLSETPRTLVAMDFCFGLPWGADREVFGVHGWLAMAQRIGEFYSKTGTARKTAETINNQFGKHGPFRFNEGRNDYHFYIDHGVAYYRLTDLATPQAISPWYLGSGATVGFHTITGLAAVADLISRRSQGDFDFHVWPQEGKPSAEGRHVLAEVYPAVYPTPSDFGKCDRGDRNQDKNQMDAWKALQWLMSVNDKGEIERFFDVAEQPFGRTANASFLDQIAFEGWILGLKEGESTNRSASTTTPSCGSGSRSP